MKHLVSLLAIVAVTGAAANASEFKTVCARGGDERLIEVMSPGEVGKSCDVRYSRGAEAAASVPYHANNSTAFCVEKAGELVQTLADAGYACASVDEAGPAVEPPPLRAEAPEADKSDYVIEARREPETAPAPLASAENDIAAPAPAVEPVALASAEGAGGELDTKMNEILALPPQPAPGAPADLTAQATEAPVSGKTPSVVGRIVGAAPAVPAAQGEAAPQTATPVTQAAIQEEPAAEAAPVAEAETAAEPALIRGPEAVAQPVAAPRGNAVQYETNATKSTPLRKPHDVVLATLNAQAAAWNEGNLDAFMDFYSKDDGLKFVSDRNITKGWEATMKRYRERYGGGAGLGRLGLEKMDVQLVTADVAVITGRFIHAKDGQSSSGVFSLVMKQENGAWRIVHDHTVADPEASE